MATNTLLAGGPWATAANWSLGTVPGTTDAVVIPSGKWPTAGPTAAATVSSLAITSAGGVSLDLHELTVSGATTVTGSLATDNQALAINGGTFEGAVTTTGNVDFSQGTNLTSWGTTQSLTATDTGELTFNTPPDNISAPNATVVINGPTNTNGDVWTWSAAYLLMPLSAGTGLTAYNEATINLTINKFLFLDGNYYFPTCDANITLTSTAIGYYLGPGAAATALAAPWVITDNRTAVVGNMTASAFAAAVQSAVFSHLDAGSFNGNGHL